jgi:hypothetical protein
MKWLLAWCIAALLTLLPPRATAGWMTPLSLSELKQSADLILHATVKSQACERTAESRIITRVQLEIGEVLKGTLATNKFTLVHGGGTVGNIRSVASAQVEYAVGEEIVVFLRLNERGEGVTLGLVQGKFQVWQDKATGEKFAHNPFHGVAERAAMPENRKPARLPLTELLHHAKGEVK